MRLIIVVLLVSLTSTSSYAFGFFSSSSGRVYNASSDDVFTAARDLFLRVNNRDQGVSIPRANLAKYYLNHGNTGIERIEEADIILVPDLTNGLDTRATMLRFLQENARPHDVVLFVNDDEVEYDSCFGAFSRPFKSFDTHLFDATMSQYQSHAHTVWMRLRCLGMGMAGAHPEDIVKQAISRRDDNGRKRIFIVADLNQTQRDLTIKQEWKNALAPYRYVALVERNVY